MSTEAVASDLQKMKDARALMEESVIDLKARSMRDNLVFTGIPKERDEDTEAVIRLLTFVKYSRNSTRNNSADATKSHLFVWDPEKCTAFENNIDNSKVDDVYSVIEELRLRLRIIQPSVEENDVNKVTDAVCNILITSAGKTLKDPILS